MKHSDLNKGRATQLINDGQHEMSQFHAIRWLMKCMSFLLNRYILED